MVFEVPAWIYNMQHASIHSIGLFFWIYDVAITVYYAFSTLSFPSPFFGIRFTLSPINFAESQEFTVKLQHRWSLKNRRFWNVKFVEGKDIARTVVKSTILAAAEVVALMVCTANGSATSHKGILSVVKNPRAHVHSLARLHKLVRLACSRSLVTRSFFCNIARTRIFPYWSCSLFECITEHTLRMNLNLYRCLQMPRMQWAFEPVQLYALHTNTEQTSEKKKPSAACHWNGERSQWARLSKYVILHSYTCT